MEAPRECSVARALAVVGERWSLLVVREVALGVRRFEGIRAATGAPRAVLADRLRRLTDAGVLERRGYVEAGARPRDEYRLTTAGRELQVVLTALRQWGDRYLAGPDGPPAHFVHDGCGATVRVEHVCEAGHHIPDSGRGLRVAPRPAPSCPPGTGPTSSGRSETMVGSPPTSGGRRHRTHLAR